MSFARKTFLILSLAVFAAGFACAMDYGFELSNKAGYSNSSGNDWFTDHKETLWLAIPFTNNNDNSLSIEGSFYASKPEGSNEYRFFADLDLFRLSLLPVSSGKIKIGMDIGRISVSDISTFVLNQAVDGTEMHFSLPFGNIDLLAGYTGLQNVRTGGALMTEDDQSEAGTNDLWAQGSQRVIGKLTFQFPQLVDGIDILFEGVGQYDLRRYLENDPTSTLDTVYGTLCLNGPITNTLFYNLSGTYQGGQLEIDEKGSVNSVLASIRFDLFPAEGDQMYLQVVYVPDRSSFFDNFRPISFQTAGTLYTAGYTNLTIGSVGWNFNPSTAFNFDILAKTFLLSDSIAGFSGFYQGTEISGGATIKATSDLRFRLDGDIWMPEGENLQYKTSLKAIFAL
jgi:hypothetical protein